MNKKHLHHLWTKFRVIKPWYFLILFVLFASVSVYALRQNNLTMSRLRGDVYTADKNNGDVGTALKNLQAYVTSHMNTNLSGGPSAPYPPIQLQYTYTRLEKASLQKLGYSNFYTKAQNYCQAKYPVDYFSYVDCTEQYVASHHLNIKVSQYVPSPSLYEFDFLSPSWSPDLAVLVAAS